MNKVLGITLIVLAIALAVVPHYTDCQSQGSLITLANGNTIPMKCHWTGIAEIGVAAPLIAVGGMVTAFRKKKQNLMTFGVLGIVLAAVALSLPTFMIGTCAAPNHFCNTAMKPAILVLGSVAALASLGLIYSASSLKE
jgi:hypothetical protein